MDFTITSTLLFVAFILYTCSRTITIMHYNSMRMGDYDDERYCLLQLIAR